MSVLDGPRRELQHILVGGSANWAEPVALGNDERLPAAIKAGKAALNKGST
jgi:hypothetical protein